MEKSNKWIQEENQEYIEEYIDFADAILVERQTTVNIMKSIFSYHFINREKNLKILDVGCGAGYLTQQLMDTYPNNEFHLLDGSQIMLKKAGEQLEGTNIQLIHKTFEEYVELPVEDMRYDFVCSANAIHHLDYVGKTRLFTKLYRELQFGGLIINIDPVMPETERTEEWQFNLWRDWMNDNFTRKDLEQFIGKYDYLPESYKSKDENKPTTLFGQLDLLSRIGYRNVDCFYKHGIYSVFGGTK